MFAKYVISRSPRCVNGPLVTAAAAAARSAAYLSAGVALAAAMERFEEKVSN